MPLASAAATMRAAHLRRIGVARTVGRVVQVVELADAGEARLQHLHIGPAPRRLDVVGRHGARGSGTSPRARSRSCRPRARAAPPARPWRAGRRGCARSATPGTATPHNPLRARRRRDRSGATAAIVRPSTVISTSRCQPSSSSALGDDGASCSIQFALPIHFRMRRAARASAAAFPAAAVMYRDRVAALLTLASVAARHGI